MALQDPSSTYRYHFTSPGLRNNRPLSSQVENNDSANKNGKISFRYFAQCKEKEKRMNSPKLDLTQYALPTPPLKNYTFSLLAKQPIQFRKTEASDLVSSPTLVPKYPVNMPKKPIVSQCYRTLTECNEQPKQVKPSKQDLANQKENLKQIVTLKKEKTYLQEKVEELTLENELLRVRLDDSKKRFGEMEALTNLLNNQLQEARLSSDKQQEKLNLIKEQKQNAEKQLACAKSILAHTNQAKCKLQINSNILTVNLPFSGSIMNGKEDALVTSLSQISELLDLPSSLAINLDFILQSIKLLKKTVDELGNQGNRIQQLQKDKSKLVHHLKKTESEMGRLYNHNTFLSSQLQKNEKLIFDYNSQIELLRIKEIQSKLASKYGHI